MNAKLFMEVAHAALMEAGQPEMAESLHLTEDSVFCSTFHDELKYRLWWRACNLAAVACGETPMCWLCFRNVHCQIGECQHDVVSTC